MYSLPYLKKQRPEFQKVYSQVLQETLMQVERRFRKFFEKARLKQKAPYPKLLEKEEWHSFTFPQIMLGTKWRGPGRLQENGTVKISGVGNVKIDIHRPMEGVPKTLTITHQNGCWYALYSCDVPSNPA